ncbi:MAG TPA: cytochrome c oxidase assembly protein [Jatrophihabitans sp.]|nr:cytochrome c oxidase assembly protein [Jatrophihabitans sp.]
MATQLTAATVLGRWSVQPVAVAAALAGLGWYLRAIRQRAAWPRRRTGWFVAGLLLWLAVCCGPATHYDRSVYWVWVSQALALLLIVPLPLMSGQPAELIRLPAFVDRLSSPLLGPALIPLVCVAALFGPVPGWAAEYAPVGWAVQLLLLLIGAVIALPLVATHDTASSIAVGVAVAVGFVELLIDAVPGIVLRLSTHPVTSFFTHRVPLAQAPYWLRDQQIGGGVLWCVAELLDLPFLVLIFRRWVRADAREAAGIDAQLAEAPADETPWFLSDPRLRDRLR